MSEMKIVRPGKAKHRCNTPAIVDAWDRLPKYVNNDLVECSCGKYYLIKTESRGSGSGYLTWKRVPIIRVRWMLRKFPRHKQ